MRGLIIKRVLPPGVRFWLNHSLRDPYNDYLDRKRLTAAEASGETLRVEIGKSRRPALPGWYRTDINTLNVWQDSDWEALFGRENRVRNLLAEHVFEHIAPKLARKGLANCLRYLEPGGRIRIAVPDGNNPDPEYIAYVEPGGVGPAADDHRVLFTVESLAGLLEEVGFVARPLEYFDSDGTFCQVPWDPSEGVVVRCGKGHPEGSLIVDGMKAPTA